MATNFAIDGNVSVGGTQTQTGATTFAGNVVFGDAVSDTVGFYGNTGTAQVSVVAAITTTQPSVTTFGFTTTAQFNNLIAAVNSILTALKGYGIMATA